MAVAAQEVSSSIPAASMARRPRANAADPVRTAPILGRGRGAEDVNTVGCAELSDIWPILIESEAAR
ncbi:hypothetical protein GCM10025790_27610 [Nesterenkonia rhizosphaerae]|uniref:Uncharacterized protein n=1 Tax=Nesterenkonia rhizosphaerae TaxID=1348272 RepID=A0ABP9G3V6_9MICC